MNTTEEGVRYFIDHENKITTFQDPRTQPNVNGKLAGVKSFRWKYGQFRYLCQSNAMTQVRSSTPGHLGRLRPPQSGKPRQKIFLVC